MEQAFMLIDFVQQELLLLASFCFLFGSLDDLAFDGLWIAYAIRQKFSGCDQNSRIMADSLLSHKADAPLAIFVPAWQEAQVIGMMLERCLTQWKHNDYRIYVGCYPNDRETIEVVQSVAKTGTQIRLVICHLPGPTSKADCLNYLWSALCRDEIVESQNFKAVILHDAEDFVHPEALDLFNLLVFQAALVQIPVIPRRAKRSRWIAGHYGDEFAELHGKQMVLREALGVSLPSAGVGCAFSRDALCRQSIQSRGKPFDASSMTEDYELGLRLTSGSARGIFARIRDKQGQLIATQEFFPDNWDDAIKQKSRWMAGIALSGWDRMGWGDSCRENWMRMRDRKASFTAVILALAYIAILLTSVLGLASLFDLYQPQALSKTLYVLLGCNLVFLLWRLAMKAYFVYGLYGLHEAALSIPRTVVANVINIMATKRAISQYLRGLSGAPTKWEKTRHFYPPLEDVERLKTSDIILRR